MRILLTGASGYLGNQLMASWLADPEVEKIIAIDLKDPGPLFTRENTKIHFIKANIADLDLDKELEGFLPIDVVAHAAYLIRTPYFKKNKDFQRHSNFKGAENIFRFALRNKVGRLIHFSSVAVYGAEKGNTLGRPFQESDAMREEAIQYGKDKKLIEKELEKLIPEYHVPTKVFILRIGSVTGPFGKIVKKEGLLRFFRSFLPFIPVTNKNSARQFIHEDDLIDAVRHCSTAESFSNNFYRFNLAPSGFITFKEAAKYLGKKILPVPHFVARIFFFFVWHLSLGKIPVPPGVIKSYSFPIVVDGSKITSSGFNYQYSCLDALLAIKGRFKDLTS